MTQPPDDAAERRLVERISSAFDPGPLAPEARVAFNDALAERLHGRRRVRRWAPALAAGALALAAAWLWWSDAPPSALTPAPAGVQTAQSTEGDVDLAWEYDLLYPAELDGALPRDDSPFLPDEYAAIASLLDAS